MANNARSARITGRSCNRMSIPLSGVLTVAEPLSVTGYGELVTDGGKNLIRCKEFILLSPEFFDVMQRLYEKASPDGDLKGQKPTGGGSGKSTQQGAAHAVSAFLLRKLYNQRETNYGYPDQQPLKKIRSANCR